MDPPPPSVLVVSPAALELGAAEGGESWLISQPYATPVWAVRDSGFPTLAGGSRLSASCPNQTSAVGLQRAC